MRAAGHYDEADLHRDHSDIGLCARKASFVIQEVALANSHSLVDRGILEEIVADNRARFAGCCTMPLTFIFFGLYISAATVHEDITSVYLMESQLRQSLLPPLGGVLTNEDVWRYVSDTVVPHFFRQKDLYAAPITNKQDWSRVFTYNQLKGPLAFEQHRSIAQPCDDDLAKHMVCYPQGKYSGEPFGLSLNEVTGINTSVLLHPDEGFKVTKSRRLQSSEASSEDGADDDSSYRRLRVMREELSRWMPKRSKDPEHLFKFFLFPSSPIKEIEQRVDYFHRRGWLDDSTSRLTMKALVLNADVHPPRIENVKWHLAFSRGGGVFASMRFENFFLRAWNSQESVILDAAFVAMLVVQTSFITAMLCKAIRQGQCRKHFKRLVNALAWVNVALSWCNALGFLMQDSFRRKVIDQIEVYDSLSLNTTTLSGYREEMAIELHKVADEMSNFSLWYRLLLTYMNLFLMLRCFLILEFQPRLAVVVATLKATSIDLLHFLVVFVPTFLAYVAAGMCIFGRRVEEFSSLERTIGTCFKIAMESEFQWKKLSEEDFVTSASWVWTFLLLIVLLMLNMVLAIIMDVYTEVRLTAGNSETVYANIIFLAKRLYLWRQWVPDDELLKTLAEMPRALTAQEFRQAFPGMTDQQYKRLMSTAVMKAQAATRTGLHNSFLSNMTAAIKVGLDQSSKSVKQLKKDQENFKVELGSRPDSVCIEDIMQSVAVQNHWMTSVQQQLEALREQTRTREQDEKDLVLGTDS